MTPWRKTSFGGQSVLLGCPGLAFCPLPASLLSLQPATWAFLSVFPKLLSKVPCSHFSRDIYSLFFSLPNLHFHPVTNSNLTSESKRHWIPCDQLMCMEWRCARQVWEVNLASALAAIGYLWWDFPFWCHFSVTCTCSTVQPGRQRWCWCFSSFAWATCTCMGWGTSGRSFST